MGRSSKGGRSRGRRGGRGRNKREPSVRDSVKLTCVRCGEYIRHPEMALASPDTGEPIHFDCAIQEVADREELGAREKICYLGQGNFGIIRYRSGSTDKDFEIRKRIAYESLEKEEEWRKNMRDKVIKPR
jgi:hypothetical protein